MVRMLTYSLAVVQGSGNDQLNMDSNRAGLFRDICLSQRIFI
jgi:hypothetical protein